MRFSGKTAIVTGGAGEIGKATAHRLGTEGCKVMIADVSPRVEEVAAHLSSLGLKVRALRVDVSAEEDVVRLTQDTLDSWGRLDVMLANAGIGGRGVADEIALVDWERILAVNLRGVFLCIKHAVPAMRASGGGAIVNTASIMGIVGTRGAFPYAAAKGAIVNLTRSAALDYAKDRIRVNAVCPGHLRSGMAVGGREQNPDAALLARYPMGRLGEPEEIAGAIAFLASDDASFITGTSLVVDGGYTAQ